jgi:lipopolysaccharide export LptBFGC system permease protein LptF
MELGPILVPIIALLIPITAIVAKLIVTPWLEIQRRKLEIDAERTAEKAAQYAAQTERLEARVRVLERIATDKGVALADEIDALRAVPDQRPLN